MSDSASASSEMVFLKDEMPFGLSYSDWSEKFWIWQSQTFEDPENSENWLGVAENGCFMRDEGPVVMLIDPAYGYTLNQKCAISSTDGILIDLWSGECDSAMKEFENASFKQISDCARGFDLGKIKTTLRVDGTIVSELQATDWTTNILNNAVESRTNEMHLTLEKGTRIPTDPNKWGGTYLAAAHGWYVILKPLSPGNHTIDYENQVSSTTLSGAGNQNLAHITYHLMVK